MNTIIAVVLYLIVLAVNGHTVGRLGVEAWSREFWILMLAPMVTWVLGWHHK